MLGAPLAILLVPRDRRLRAQDGPAVTFSWHSRKAVRCSRGAVHARRSADARDEPERGVGAGQEPGLSKFERDRRAIWIAGLRRIRLLETWFSTRDSRHRGRIIVGHGIHLRREKRTGIRYSPHGHVRRGPDGKVQGQRAKPGGRIGATRTRTALFVAAIVGAHERRRRSARRWSHAVFQATFAGYEASRWDTWHVLRMEQRRTPTLPRRDTTVRRDYHILEGSPYTGTPTVGFQEEENLTPCLIALPAVAECSLSRRGSVRALRADRPFRFLGGRPAIGIAAARSGATFARRDAVYAERAPSSTSTRGGQNVRPFFVSRQPRLGLGVRSGHRCPGHPCHFARHLR